MDNLEIFKQTTKLILNTGLLYGNKEMAVFAAPGLLKTTTNLMQEFLNYMQDKDQDLVKLLMAGPQFDGEEPPMKLKRFISVMEGYKAHLNFIEHIEDTPEPEYREYGKLFLRVLATTLGLDENEADSIVVRLTKSLTNRAKWEDNTEDAWNMVWAVARGNAKLSEYDREDLRDALFVALRAEADVPQEQLSSSVPDILRSNTAKVLKPLMLKIDLILTLEIFFEDKAFVDVLWKECTEFRAKYCTTKRRKGAVPSEQKTPGE